MLRRVLPLLLVIVAALALIALIQFVLGQF